MNNKIIIYICIASFAITYIALYACDHINKKDKQKINCSSKYKIILSTANTVLIALLFIKYAFSVYSIFYIIIWIVLFVIAYIDYSTKFIYDFMAKPLMIIALILIAINLITKKSNLEDIVLLAIPFAFIILFQHLNYIGKGDIQIFFVSMIVVNDFLRALILVIFSFGISGIASIFMMIFKKVGLNYRKPLCPSIAIATYVILLIM